MNTEITSIPIGLIDPCPVNPRKTFDEAQLCELSVSIAKMGVTNPIIVRPGYSPEDHAELRYELVCGHRRTEAAKRAGLTEVPAIMRDLNDTEALDLAIVDNLQRVDLSPMEEAEGYALLMNQKCTVHKHRVEQPQARMQNGNDPKVKADREAKEKAYVVSETPIRRAVYEAIRAQKISTASLIRVLIEAAVEDVGDNMGFCKRHGIKVPGNFWDNRDAAIRKYIQSIPEKDLPGLAAEVLCYDELTVQDWNFNLVERERQILWGIAKAFGVDPDAIVAKLAKPVSTPSKPAKKPAAPKKAAKPNAGTPLKKRIEKAIAARKKAAAK